MAEEESDGFEKWNTNSAINRAVILSAYLSYVRLHQRVSASGGVVSYSLLPLGRILVLSFNWCHHQRSFSGGAI